MRRATFSPVSGPGGPSSSMRLIRVVRGRRGAQSLYERSSEIVEVLAYQEHADTARILELYHYSKARLPAIQKHMDGVEAEVAKQLEREPQARSRGRPVDRRPKEPATAD